MQYQISTQDYCFYERKINPFITTWCNTSGKITNKIFGQQTDSGTKKPDEKADK
jgi:hypothetical protein